MSLISLIGLLTISMNEARVRRLAAVFVAFAVGALLGDAFIHLIPEVFRSAEARRQPLPPSLLILGGMMIFFVVEKLVRHKHAFPSVHEDEDRLAKPELMAINILGDAVHNFIDGVLIGASYLAGSALGVSTTLAVFLHEVPQEMGDFGILIHSGLSVRRAILWNLASASTAVLGTVLALVAGSVAEQAVTGLLLPLAAGGFVYLAAADLIPELQHDRRLGALAAQSSLILLGIAIMGLLKLTE